MLLNEQYNTLFHRCVNRDKDPRTMKEVYESPLVNPFYKNTSYENPLINYLDFHDQDTIVFGTYNNTPIEWIIVDYDSREKALILISKDILFTREFDSGTNYWGSSSLRNYLNTDFYNQFTDEEKSYICGVITDPGDYDYVFLLSYDTNNYKIKSYASLFYNKSANYNGSACSWWLMSPGSSDNYTDIVHYYNGNWTYGETYKSNASIGVRPMIVLDVRYYQEKHSLINPLYCERVWGLDHTNKETNRDLYGYVFGNRKFPLSEYFTVSEQISVHNPRLQGKANIPELYNRVKRDFAIYTKDTTYNYIRFFAEETSTEQNLQDGLYLTFSTVYLVKASRIYASGNLPANSGNSNTIETVFFANMQEVSSIPNKAIYTSCWEDLNPILELYMPYKERDKSIFWLGERFVSKAVRRLLRSYLLQNDRYLVNDNIYTLLSDLLCTNFTLYI